MKSSAFHHLHVHSDFSILDALSSVQDIVAKAARMGHPAVAMTDHGNLAATVQLYKAGKQHGIQVYPGMEGYLTTEPITGAKDDGKLPRYHIGLLALNLEGYRALVKLSSLSHTRPRFHQKFPRFDLNDLAELSLNAGEDVAVLTGCFFGLVQQALMDKGIAAAKRIIEMYAKWFPNTFVELQNHNIEHGKADTWRSPWQDNVTDADICDVLYGLAQEVGLPVVITQDAHYLKQSERKAHNLLKKMVYGGADDEFPGDFFHLASTEWVKEHHEEEHWESAEEGFDYILSINKVDIPALDVFTSHVPSTKPAPHRWLRRLAFKKLREFKEAGLIPRASNQDKYHRRLEHELDIINYCHAAGYFTIWHDFVLECKKRKICIEARGSANGSLVCFLLGITQVDPIKWGLLFERFMSRDRQKPPDIDMDIEDDRRMEMIEWVGSRPGMDVMQIGTFNVLGAREEDDKGSVLVTYNSYLRRKLGNDKFVPRFGRGIEYIEDVKGYSYRDYKALRALSKNEVKKSAGVHAAGLLISGESQRIEDYVPSMLIASSDTIVTQFNMDDVEELGYEKMDILGLKTLTVLKRCQELIGRKDPTDFSWIPLNDMRTCRELSKGQGDNGIFQFEGYAMANGAKVMKIKNTNDCILAGALFRPACMDSGVTDTYIERRFNKSLVKDVRYPHKAFKILDATNGVVLFQEQVLEIMRGLGVSFGEINTFFKMVKDSGKGATERNIERARLVKRRWQEICDMNEIDDPDEAWHYIEGYVKYGFNKAHAAGYGIRSYRAAYLKTHYPLEYMAALLESWAGSKKEAKYIKEARRIGIRLLSPDVNISNANWTLDKKRGAIRKGLTSIKGIGKAAQEIASNKPYDSIEELVKKNSGRAVSGGKKFIADGTWSGNLEKLRSAGALKSLGIGRDE